MYYKVFEYIQYKLSSKSAFHLTTFITCQVF
nr:MAG TPA: hypothetical protein [Caudoviricetes sp.]